MVADALLSGLCFLRVLGGRKISERLVVLNPFTSFHVVTVMRYPPHGQWKGCWVVVVQAHGLQVGLDGVGRLVGMVPGHLVKEMVGDVGGADAVVEKIEDTCERGSEIEQVV